MKKKWSKRSLRVFSRHPSHNIVRKAIYVPVLACIRFGSTTEWRRSEYEINSIEAVKNSSNKLRMKKCFDEAEVITATWWEDAFDVANLEEIPFPILAKRKFGSRGNGMVKIDNQEGLEEFINENNTSNFIFEKFHNYSREYRLHVDAQGCFYTCRKMLKSDAPEENRWFRNDSNCVWYLEDNEKFDKPSNWDTIVSECVKALKAVGLDVGACDVKVQSATKRNGEKREEPKFIIIEINSAPSFGDVTSEKYKERIPSILTNKYDLNV